jgi:hypothetical protein
MRIEGYIHTFHCIIEAKARTAQMLIDDVPMPISLVRQTQMSEIDHCVGNS